MQVSQLQEFYESEIVKQAIRDGLIRFDNSDVEKIKNITYRLSNKTKQRNINNPEEIVQAKSFLELIYEYQYPIEKIDMIVSITMGASNKEADIVIYQDEERLKPYIIVECKKEEVSEQEFVQASSQAFSYAHATAGMVKYVWVTSGIKDEYFKVDKDSQVKETVVDIPKYNQNYIAPYKYIKGGKLKTGEKFLELVTVKESELTRRFQQAHQALWGGGELNPSQAFDELDKLIFCKIWDEKNCLMNKPYGFQIMSAQIDKDADDSTKKAKEQKAVKELAERIEKLYIQGRKEDPEVFKDDIRLTPRRIYTVVGYLQDINLSETDLDSKGKAFETFMGSFFRGDFGQFFTPRPIVNFIVNSLPINKSSYVLDTSCGSGGFLLHALDKVRKDEAKRNDVNSALYYKNWHDFASTRLFGIEINEQIARTAKMNMIIHDDGHTNVISCDGLSDISDIQTINREFKENKFDFIITNPPFGSLVKQTEKAYLRNYNFGIKEVDWLDFSSSNSSRVRNNQKSEILFIEQCHRFLAPCGFLAIVLPDGILTNSTMQYVRDGIEDKYRVVAVVSMPQIAFSNTGAGVKSSVLFLRKYSDKMTQKIKDAKLSLQTNAKIENYYEEKINEINNEKKEHLKELRGLDIDIVNNDAKELKKKDEYKMWKSDVNSYYNNKINELKEKLREAYQKKKNEIIIKEKLTDYDVFMADAKHIGYDATGHETGINELNLIEKELEFFINTKVLNAEI